MSTYSALFRPLSSPKDYACLIPSLLASVFKSFVSGLIILFNRLPSDFEDFRSVEDWLETESCF